MSQNEGTTESIGGSEYTVYMLPPMISHDLLMDVAKMVGPALGPVFDTFFSDALKGGKANILDQAVSPEFFTKAAGALFGGLDKKVLREVIDKMTGVTHVDGKPLKPIFDMHFRGKLDVMYRWLAFNMQVQWGKSLGALGSIITTRGAEAIATASQSPSTSDG